MTMTTKKYYRRIANEVFKDNRPQVISDFAVVPPETVNNFVDFINKAIDKLPDDLKPCPFCGSEDVSVDTMLATGYVRCKTCQAFGPTVCSKTNKEAVEEAIKLWNKRNGDDDGN